MTAIGDAAAWGELLAGGAPNGRPVGLVSSTDLAQPRLRHSPLNRDAAGDRTLCRSFPEHQLEQDIRNAVAVLEKKRRIESKGAGLRRKALAHGWTPSEPSADFLDEEGVAGNLEMPAAMGPMAEPVEPPLDRALKTPLCRAFERTLQ